jgi:hypothetical protein
MKSNYRYEDVDSRLIEKLNFFNYRDKDAARALQCLVDSLVDEDLAEMKKRNEELVASVEKKNETIRDLYKRLSYVEAAHWKSTNFLRQSDDAFMSVSESKNPAVWLLAKLVKWPAPADKHLRLQESTASLAVAEMIRQDVKWGPARQQPNGTGTSYFKYTADMHRRRTDEAFQNGEGTWAHILLEEVYEALAESNPRKLVAELVQVAAVCLNWIVSLKLQASKGIWRKG